jgi:hypothetical protein
MATLGRHAPFIFMILSFQCVSPCGAAECTAEKCGEGEDIVDSTSWLQTRVRRGGDKLDLDVAAPAEPHAPQTPEANQVGASSGHNIHGLSEVYFEICAEANANVTCAYDAYDPDTGSKSYTIFGAVPPTYDGSTGKWTCAAWGAGSFSYNQRITVDGTDYFTTEQSALSVGSLTCQASTATTTQADGWVKGLYGQVCNDVCASIGKVCSSDEPSSLNTYDQVRDAFASAGYTCRGRGGGRSYAGAPFSTGRDSDDCFWIGSGAVSSCSRDQNPGHAPLCYCKASHSYTKLEGYNCGWTGSGGCADDNNLFIGTNGERWDSTTALAAQSTCGPVCSSSSECGGFTYVASNQKCYYRKDATCGMIANSDRDCYQKQARPSIDEIAKVMDRIAENAKDTLKNAKDTLKNAKDILEAIDSLKDSNA